MKTSTDGFQQCDNALVVVDAEQQLIVVTQVDANASDPVHLVAMLDEELITIDELRARTPELRR